MTRNRVLALALCAALLATGASECHSSDSADSSSGSSSKPESLPAVSAPAQPDSAQCATYRTIMRGYAKKNRTVKDLDLQVKNMADMDRELAQVFPNVADELLQLASLYDKAYEGDLSAAEEQQLGPLEEKVATQGFSRYCSGGYPSN